MSALDQADGAVDEIHAVQAEIAPHVVHERGSRPRHVQLGDHFAAAHRRAQAPIERAVVVLEVQVELVRVAPVELAVGRQIVPGEASKGGVLVGVGELQQFVPVLCESRRCRRESARVRDRPVAGEHAAAKESRDRG